MNRWLRDAVDAVGGGAELSEGDAQTLLELARLAAHESGDRRNAPLLCYLIGRVQGERDLDELLEAVRRSTS
jgi:Domain of unknown function (DUF6457)